MATISIELLAVGKSMSDEDKSQLNQIVFILNDILKSDLLNLSFQTDLKLTQNVCSLLKKNGFEINYLGSKTQISFKNCVVDIIELKKFNSLDFNSPILSNMILAKCLKCAILQKNQHRL